MTQCNGPEGVAHTCLLPSRSGQGVCVTFGEDFLNGGGLERPARGPPQGPELAELLGCPQPVGLVFTSIDFAFKFFLKIFINMHNNNN